MQRIFVDLGYVEIVYDIGDDIGDVTNYDGIIDNNLIKITTFYGLSNISIAYQRNTSAFRKNIWLTAKGFVSQGLSVYARLVD